MRSRWCFSRHLSLSFHSKGALDSPFLEPYRSSVHTAFFPSGFSLLVPRVRLFVGLLPLLSPIPSPFPQASPLFSPALFFSGVLLFFFFLQNSLPKSRGAPRLRYLAAPFSRLFLSPSRQSRVLPSPVAFLDYRNLYGVTLGAIALSSLPVWASLFFSSAMLFFFPMIPLFPFLSDGTQDHLPNGNNVITPIACVIAALPRHLQNDLPYNTPLLLRDMWQLAAFILGCWIIHERRRPFFPSPSWAIIPLLS